uniref:Protein transport protein Sec24B n=1 Tax=Panagrolaimus sp. JU765 TaxID=591449 RepID=A0AC34RIQ8_9BILA
MNHMPQYAGSNYQQNGSGISPSVCNPWLPNNQEIFRCTVGAIPETPKLSTDCRLPLALTLHPFRDQRNLHVIKGSIVRCRYCRAYINPYIYMPDNRHWRCNICYRSNDIPDEFYFDHDKGRYGDPTTRPEIQNNTVEFIATSDYMLRPPQPACYFFVLDVSKSAIESGYLHIFAEQLSISLDMLPGGENVLVGFMCVDSALHFFQFIDGENKPRHLVSPDCDEAFQPVYDGLIVNLNSHRQSVGLFVQSLPALFEESTADDGNCLGVGLQLAFSLINEIGGRVTVMQARLPNLGVGSLKNRENKENKTQNFGPATDFYKRLALESVGKQVSYDLFVLGRSSIDLATLAEMSKVSGGSVYYFPNFHAVRNIPQVKRYEKLLVRYLTRKIGFEAVLRIRCSRGVSLHSFYGNFFVRSTDLLAIPTVSPDAALGVQLQVDESLSGQQTICFQAALLYTSSRGDRRIRVHTMCLPIVTEIRQMYETFDLQACGAMLAKMASERAMTGSDLSDCREGIINAGVDAFASYNKYQSLQSGWIYSPIAAHLKLFIKYVLGCLKHRAFSSSSAISTDEQVALMLFFRTAAIEAITLELYPALYAVHDLIPGNLQHPARLPLTYECINQRGIYVLDTGSFVYLYVTASVHPQLIESYFGVNGFGQIDEDLIIQQRDNPYSEVLFAFIRTLQAERAGYFAPIITIREDSPRRHLFTGRLIEDRTEKSHSLIEFYHHIEREISR